MTMNTFYTYIYKDPSRNNEPIYVGKGSGNRAYWHWSKKSIWKKKKHPFLQRLDHMHLKGVKPIIEFLCNEVDSELALFVEKEAISLYGRKDLGKGSLLNLTDGGDNPPSRLGKKNGEKWREAISKINTPERSKKISDSITLWHANRKEK
jgi:hypothetical protein